MRFLKVNGECVPFPVPVPKAQKVKKITKYQERKIILLELVFIAVHELTHVLI